MSDAIVLIGPMGAGKSEVGAALAQRLGRPFLETDQIVERNANSKIATIFSDEGESGFRIREEAAVAEAVKVARAVISCGGGAVTSAASCRLLKRAGLVVYLKIDADGAASRISNDASRPLLAGHDPKSRLSELIANREPAYEAIADHVVGADGDVEQVVARVLEVVDL